MLGIMVCPYCKQGEVRMMMYKQNNLIFYICDECEAIWEQNEPITDQSGDNLERFFANRNIKTPLWKDFTEL